MASETIELNRAYADEHHRNTVTSIDVVFIHGLGGDLVDTWESPKTTSWWPRMVAHDFPTAAVWTFGYPATIGKLEWFRCSTQLTTTELADAMLGRLRSEAHSGLGHRPCIFVCHSLGGLIAKRMLLASKGPAQPDQFDHCCVKGIMFLGTPHHGSNGADLLNALSDGQDVAKTSPLVRELKEGSESLKDLNRDFGLYFLSRDSVYGSPLRTRVLGETEPVTKFWVSKTIVNAKSANPDLRYRPEGAPIPLILVPGADHLSLVKPDSRAAQVHAELRGLIHSVHYEVDHFEFTAPLRNNVAWMVFEKLTGQKSAMGASCFKSLCTTTHELDNRRARQLTEKLVQPGADVLQQITAIRLLD